MNASTSEARGFTLIELLVVIAIIGILSSVVLASLALGRMRSQDAAIKTDLHTIQNQIELYYTNSNTYGPTINQTSAQTSVPGSGTSVYFLDATINGALKEAMKEGGSGYWAVGQNGASWAVAIKLKADSGYWWCVDSRGQPVREPNASMVGSALHGGAAAAAYCP